MRIIRFITTTTAFLVILQTIQIHASATTTTTTTTNDKGPLQELYNAAHFLTELFVGHKKEQHIAQHSIPASPSAQGLQVIGAGFARTGTKSTEAALNLLGYKVYDAISMMQHDHVERWIEAAADMKYRQDYRALEELTREVEELGYTATLDNPMNLFALGLAKIRPDAKVLMTVRDSPQVWYESYKGILMIISPATQRPFKWILGEPVLFPFVLANIIMDWTPAMGPEQVDRVFPWFDRLIDTPLLMSKGGEQSFIDMYVSFQEMAQRELSESRLLIFNVKQGWEPLLTFLNLTAKEAGVDGTDYPRVNERKALVLVSNIVQFLGMTAPLWVGLLVLMVGYVVRSVFLATLKRFFGNKIATTTNKKMKQA